MRPEPGLSIIRATAVAYTNRREGTGLVAMNPLDPAFLADPYPTYAALRTQDPVHQNPMLQGWVLTRYDDCIQTLRDHETYSSDARQGASALVRLRVQQRADMQMDAATVLTSDPPVHTHLRALVSKAFTPARVEGMRGHIEEVTESLLDEAGETFDVIEGLAQPLPIIVIAEMLGVPPEDRDTFKRWSTSIAALTNPMISPQLLAEVQRVRDELGDYIGQVVEERRRAPREDLISALVEAEEEGNVLSIEELFGFVVLLLAAGNETTTNLIGNGTLALMQNPEQAALLREEPSLVVGGIEELLRYDSPVQTTIRFALTETEIGGRRIAKGDSVLAMLGAANRDPAHFVEPDRLDVRREENRHIAFGLGIHHCLGAPLARLEAEVAFRALLRRFEELAPAEEAPERGGTFALRGLRRLSLRCGASTGEPA